MIRIEHNPSRKQLILFGFLWLVFFSFWGAVAWRDSGKNWLALLLWATAIVIPVAGIIRSEVLRGVFVLASYITFPIGWILSSIVLVLLYYLTLTPIGILLRLTGYDPMKRRFDRTAKSYWLARNPDTEIERYFKQF